MISISHSIKAWTVCALSSLLLMMSGCLSLTTVSNANKIKLENIYITVDKDVIHQMGLVETDDNAKQLAFFGDKYAYLIQQGAEQIQLTTKLDARYLQFENPIYVNLVNDNQLRSFLKFNYHKQNGYYQQQELDVLNQFCRLLDSTNQTEPAKNKSHANKSQLSKSHINGEYYQCQIYVEGNLYQTNKQLMQTTTFNQGQPIVIQQVGTNYYKRRSSLLALPMTALVDVVTLPFQVVGVGATLAVMHE